MDPVTAIAAATTAYNAIKKGFEVGKEIESMAGDVGRWMNAVNTIKDSHNNEVKSKRKFGSVEEEALETFAAMKKAKKMEDELRIFIMMNYGPNAWQELLRVQAEIRKARLAEKERKEKQIEQVIEWFWIILLCAGAGAVFIWLIWIINNSANAFILPLQ